MTLHVYHARINYRGPDTLDITRGTAEKARKAGLPRPHGEFLAPSAGLVFPTLRRLRAARTPEDKARVWAAYEVAFLAEMALSQEQRAAEWEAVEALERVCLTCFCVDHRICHRRLVGEIYRRRGAIYHGAIAP